MATRTGSGGRQQPSQRGGQPQDQALLKLKQQYPEELQSLKTLFGDWSDHDLLATLEEVRGDLDLAIGRISEGHAEQWGEVKSGKKKDKPKTPKVEGGASNERGPRSIKQGGPAGDFDGGRPPRGSGYAGRGGRGGGRGGRGGGRGGSVNGAFHPRPPRQNGISQQRNGPEPVSSTEADANAAAAPAEEWGNSDPNADSWNNPSTGDTWGASAATNGAWDAATPGNASASPAKTVSKPEHKSNAAQSTVVASSPAKSAGQSAAPSRPGVGAKTSWAQLVKGPEPVAPPTPSPAAPKVDAKQPIARPKPPSVSEQSVQPVPAREPSPVRAPSPVRSPPRPASPAKEQVSAPASPSKLKQETPVSPSSPVSKAVSKPASRPSSPVKPSAAAAIQPSAPVAPQQQQIQTLSPSESAVEQNAGAAKAVPAGPPGLKQARQPVARKLKQDAAVVMPSNATLSSIGVQFGSLRLGGSEDEETEAPSPSAAVPAQSQPSVKPGYQETAQQMPPQTATTASGVPSSTAQPHLQQYQHLQQQQQAYHHGLQQQQTLPQSQSARDPRISAPSSIMPQMNAPVALQGALPKQTEGLPLGLPTGGPVTAGGALPTGVPPYASYFPTQQLGASGFGMNHMGSPADYSNLYSSEAQARAAVMGYYDPAAYQAAASKYQTPDAHSAPSTQGQQSPQGQAAQQQPHHQQAQHQHQQQSQQQGAQQQAQGGLQQQQGPQQGYPLPYYYPYYHLPNQYPSYQSSIYGQQFVNKSVYPGYTQQTGQPSTTPGSTQQKSSAISNAGQYGYSSAQQQPLYQQGYDDLASGLATQDYKSASSVYGGMPQQSFQPFGLNSGQPGSGVQGAGVQKAGAAQQTGGQQAGEYKSQANRGARQSYEPHKYQAGVAGAQGGQPTGGLTAGSTGAGAAGQAGSQSNQGASSYYNQHQLAGLHAQQAQQQHLGGYSPHLMHQHQQQHQQQPYQSNLYNQSGRQQGQYWAGQS
ncbi:RNAPII degradation factor [Borealophlyctis nickersoniae]|nr:RNAPII degradation factor [Borealophlyctis nickersoniae]